MSGNTDSDGEYQGTRSERGPETLSIRGMEIGILGHLLKKINIISMTRVLPNALRWALKIVYP